MMLFLTFAIALMQAPAVTRLPQQAPADTLRLADLRADAAARDPRAVQPELLERATQLRLDNLRAARRPQVAFSGQATLQSDAPNITLPTGESLAPPLEQFRVQAEADWSVFDGGRSARSADVERARLAEQSAGVEVTLYSIRQAVNDAYFGALLAQKQLQTLKLTTTDLQARHEFISQRVRQGAALQSDADALRAEILTLGLQADEIEARRLAALAVLGDLTGRTLNPDVALAIPSFQSRAETTRQRLSAVEPDIADLAAGRPEFTRIARTQARAEAEALMAASATKPIVSLFGQAGAGRPSPFDFLSSDVAPYGLVGVRIRWAPLDWGQSRRNAEAARIQVDIAQTEADALGAGLQRQVQQALADLDRLDRAAETDATVLALRAEVLRVAGVQLDEGALLLPDYVDRSTDHMVAALTQSRHEVERAQAEATLLSILGRFPEGDAPTVR